MRNRLFLAVVVVFIVAGIVVGGTTGKVAGTVVDKQSGKPLAGVNIILVGTMMGAATDENGRYVIFDVPPGLYTIEASFIGYTKVSIKNIRVSVDLTTTVDFELEPEAIKGKEIVVVAKRPIIEKSATNERRVVRAEDVENLPVRQIQDIAALQTGVVRVGNDLYVRGGRREEVAYYVDGVYQVNLYDLSVAADISARAIEEVSYQAGGFDAEYGSANSGIVNVSTRIGGEKPSFSFEAVTDEFLSEEEKILGTYSYGYNLYNFTFGGPIGKRIRYFGSLERQFQRDRRTSVGPHPKGEWLGDLDGDGIKEYDEYDVKMVYGPLPGNKAARWLGVGNLLFDFKPIKIKVGGNLELGERREYIHEYSAFNWDRMPKRKDKTYSFYSRLTWAINPRTLMKLQYSYFFDGFERGDPIFWDDFLKYGIRELPISKYEEIYSGTISDTSKYDYYVKDEEYWLVVQPQLSANGVQPRDRREYALFTAPGHVYDDYSKNETSYKGFSFDFKTQRGVHELKFGGELRYHTIRYYRIAAPIRLGYMYIENPPYTAVEFDSLKSVGAPGVRKYEDYEDYIEKYWFNAYKYAYAENLGYTIDGKNYINEDVTKNRDGMRRPVVGGFYLQDKIELKDLIVNLGVRYDYINPSNLRFRNPTYIVIDSLGFIAERVYKDENGEYTSYQPTYDINGNPIDLVGVEQLIPSKKYKIISPRLGFAFPVTDRTVFHAQYGKYVQQPELNRVLISYLRFASNLQQGNFTISGNPDLEPVKTTAYELGFRQQIGMNSSVDITVFYKQLTGYVQVRNVVGARPVVYATYVNGDYGTVKGLSFSYQLRRTGRVQAFVNYTLQWANGTGSTATSQYRIAWQGGNYPTYVAPLDYDQRHTGSINLDIRSTEKDIIGKAGLNILLTFGSGRRYTPTAINSAVFPRISDTPIAAINSGVMPWTYQIDVKLDKTFNFGNTRLVLYVWISNLLNTKNVRYVYEGTGLPDTDGWFNTSEGKMWMSNPDNRVDLYEMMVKHPYNWETPRTIRFGLKFEI